jgi:hypothetical protein
MPTAVMSKEQRDQAILGTFALLELDDQLIEAVEELEEIAGPQPTFSNFARGFGEEIRNRVLSLVKDNVADPRVQAAMLKVIRIGGELLERERAELQSPATPEAVQKLKDVEHFDKFLRNEIAKPILEAISNEWQRQRTEARLVRNHERK